MALTIIETIQLAFIMIQALALWFIRRSTKSSTAVVWLSLNVIVLALTSYIIFVYGSNDVLQMIFFVLELIMLPVSWRSLKIAEWLERN